MGSNAISCPLRSNSLLLNLQMETEYRTIAIPPLNCCGYVNY